MFVESLSLLTAFCYGLNSVLIRKGMKNSNPFTGTVIAGVVQIVLMSILFLILPPGHISWMGLVFFAFSGVMASALGRLCNYISIEQLGVPVSSSVIGSSPMFSILFAALLLGEAIDAPVLAGTVLVVIGVTLTSRGSKAKAVKLRNASLILPVLSAIFYGASSAFRKLGLIFIPDPVLGSLVGSVATLLFFSIYLTTDSGRRRFCLNLACLGYFVVSGIVVSLGWLSMFTALLVGNVSVVSTLVGSNPLFSSALSLIFLRQSDKLDWSVALGSLVIVFGVTIITLL